MIEALDLEKASQVSAEMLRRAGFGDEASLRLILRHHQKRESDGEPNLHLLQLANRLASSQRGGCR